MKLLGFLSLLQLWSPAVATERSGDPRPNVVLLLADDLGWTGLGCFGSDLYRTPHLDRLADQGVKFTNAYSACTVCSPTRASIMTGQYPARLHLTDFIAGQNRPWAKLKIPPWTKELEQRHVTIAERLRDRGYVTAHIGKWHLARRKGRADGGPAQHGFDIQHLKPPQAKGYHLPSGFNRDGESRSDYLTDYLTDQAVSVIDEHQDRPFFLYFAYHTPHTPIQGRQDLVVKYSQLVLPNARHHNPHYAAMVESLDQSVGRILDRLRKHQLERQTLVIFCSDNGTLTQRYGKLDHFTDNYPLRRGKGSAYEGGVRVPAIVRWPSVTTAGSVCHEPIMTTDWYPTVLQATRNPQKPISNNAEAVDGVDLTPLLRNPNDHLDRDLFWHYPHYHAGGDSPYGAIRSGDWRLIEFFEDQSIRLYNLADDPGEQHDLSKSQPGRVQQLRDKLHRWRQTVDAQMPTPNPDHDPQRDQQVRRKP